MWRGFLISLFTLTLAFGILLTSIFRTAAVKYEFARAGPTEGVLGESEIHIDYYLAFPGRILPDHFLWPVKALRDRLWLLLTTNPGRKAELKLLFADKRVAAAKNLCEKGKSEVAYATLTRAEKYLEQALHQEKENEREGMDTSEFLQRLALSALKHYQLMEEMKLLAPEDAKPHISKTQKYAKKVFEEAKDSMLGKGLTPPENPFDW